MKPVHFDPDALLAGVLGSTATAHAVLQVFSPWQASTRAELQAAAASGDRRRLGRLAHSVRGALLQLHATRGAALAREVEARCADESSACAAAADALQDELRALDDEISRWLEAHAEPRER